MTDNNIAISASQLSKIYELGDAKVEVLSNVDLEIKNGEFIAISGPSGSGKTTLLNIISSIDKPTSGKIVVLGNDLGVKNEDFLANFRCSNVGFVFQSYNLVSTLTVAENVAFPMEWLHKSGVDVQKRVGELLETVGMSHRRDHFPFQLSGGEQQRVAFARALANNPPLLLLDEPTGNLDKKTSLKIIQLMEELKVGKKTVIAATHDDRIIELADRLLCLEDGKLVVGE
jgi:putative ABC transport system ATP-binding protein